MDVSVEPPNLHRLWSQELGEAILPTSLMFKGVGARATSHKPDNCKGIISAVNLDMKPQRYFDRSHAKAPHAFVAPDNALFVLWVKGCALHDLHATRKTNIAFAEPAVPNSIMNSSGSESARKIYIRF